MHDSSKRGQRHAFPDRRRAVRVAALLALGFAAIGISAGALAQQAGGPPAVGVVKAERRPITTTFDFVGRVEAIGKVDLRARVTGFLQERTFEEGKEVTENELLFKIEPSQFQAEVEQRKADLASAQAELVNKKLDLTRAQELERTQVGTRVRLENATAAQQKADAAVMGAEAALKLAEINLGYTEIHAPLAGKIGRSTYTVGALVGSDAGTLATIVSQDPMRVSFPISVREGFAIREQLGGGSGAAANVRVRIKLPDGSDYPHLGKIDFVDSQVDRSTDTVLIRATLANPVTRKGSGNARDLIDGAVVTVKIEGSEPQMAVTVPRSALLVDQQGPYVIVVDKESLAQVRRVRLGQGTAEIAAIDSGLEAGEVVVVEGVQRVRPGQPVTPTQVVPATRQDRMPK